MVAERSIDGLAHIREASRVLNGFKAQVGLSDYSFTLELTNRSIEEVLLAGNYDFIDPKLLANWDYYRFENRASISKITVKLAQFDTTIKCGEVVCEIFRDSLIDSFFPGHYSLLELGAQYPDEQRKRPIVSFDPLGRVICLFGDSDIRGVALGHYDLEWSARCSFLVANRRIDPIAIQ